MSPRTRWNGLTRRRRQGCLSLSGFATNLEGQTSSPLIQLLQNEPVFPSSSTSWLTILDKTNCCGCSDGNKDVRDCKVMRWKLHTGITFPHVDGPRMSFCSSRVQTQTKSRSQVEIDCINDDQEDNKYPLADEMDVVDWTDAPRNKQESHGTSSSISPQARDITQKELIWQMNRRGRRGRRGPRRRDGTWIQA